MTARYGARRSPFPPTVGTPYQPPHTRATGAGANWLAWFPKPVQQAHEDCTIHAGVFLAAAIRKRDGLPDVGLLSRACGWRYQQALMSVRAGEGVREHGYGLLTDTAFVLMQGLPPESAWPYDSRHYLKDFTASETPTFLAQGHKATGIAWLDAGSDRNDTDLMRRALDNRQPFAFAVDVPAGFALVNGVLQPWTREQLLTLPQFGHACVCYGCSGSDFLCLNTSWSGKPGAFVVPEAVMADRLRTYNHFTVLGMSG